MAFESAADIISTECHVSIGVIVLVASVSPEACEGVQCWATSILAVGDGDVG
jgi:hypothetical protein